MIWFKITNLNDILNKYINKVFLKKYIIILDVTKNNIIIRN